MRRSVENVGKLKSYLSLMRIDHWVKNLIIFLGSAFALIILELDVTLVLSHIGELFTGFVVMSLASSANYVMNEVLDAKFDIYHPRKKIRAAAVKSVSPYIAWLLYGILIALSFFILSLIQSSNDGFRALSFVITTYFVLAVLYNVKPMRAKDVRILDVIVESANNPIRLIFGWLLISPETVPPTSLVICFWFIGMFLMSAKRLAEFTELSANKFMDDISLYRRSLGSYSRKSLTTLTLICSQFSSALLLVFVLKYSAEFTLFFVLYIVWAAKFFNQIFEDNSVAQAPEKMIRDKSVIFFIFAMGITLLIAFLDLPVTERVQEIIQSTNLKLRVLLR